MPNDRSIVTDLPKEIQKMERMNVSTTKANQKDLHLEGNWSILVKYS
jgi:hypothetical protein